MKTTEIAKIRQLEFSNPTSEVTSDPPLDSAMMRWKIKAHPHPMRMIDIALGMMTSIPVGFFLAGLLFYEDEAEGNFIASQSAFPMLLLLFLWLVVARKKTIYSYILTEDGAHVEDWQDYASFTPYIFKGIAITFFVAVLTMIAMEPSFIWMLAGPGAMAFAASSKLMTVENPVRQRTKKWSRYDLVFIDRKRKMIVTSYQNNTMAGFEIHVEKRRIDEVVALLKTLMPNAEFREEEWKW